MEANLSVGGHVIDEHRGQNWVYRSAAILLLLTALAKIYSAGGNARVLVVEDKLLHLGYRPLMVLSATLEVGLAVFLLINRSELKRSLALLWLSSNFIFYHIGNYVLGIHRCPCLGQLADRLPLPRGFPEMMLQVLVLYWFVSSLSLFWRVWGSQQRARFMSARGLLRKLEHP